MKIKHGLKNLLKKGLRTGMSCANSTASRSTMRYMGNRLRELRLHRPIHSARLDFPNHTAHFERQTPIHTC